MHRPEAGHCNYIYDGHNIATAKTVEKYLTVHGSLPACTEE